MAVGMLTRCFLLYSVHDLKVAHMKVQRSLIRKLLFSEMEPDHNAAEATKTFIVRKN